MSKNSFNFSFKLPPFFSGKSATISPAAQGVATAPSAEATASSAVSSASASPQITKENFFKKIFSDGGCWTSDQIISAIHDDPSLATAQDSGGYNLLHHAVAEDDLNLVKFLCGEEVDQKKLPTPTQLPNINATSEGGQTPLNTAVAQGSSDDIIIFLLDKGADANIPDNCDQIPLHLAFDSSRSSRLITKIFAKTKNVDLCDDQGRTPKGRAKENAMIFSASSSQSAVKNPPASSVLEQAAVEASTKPMAKTVVNRMAVVAEEDLWVEDVEEA